MTRISAGDIIELRRVQYEILPTPAEERVTLAGADIRERATWLTRG